MVTPRPALANETEPRWASAHNEPAPPRSLHETATWVGAAQSGDRSAFAHLHRAYGPMVHGILLARVDPALVDDLAQDVFLEAMGALSTLREPAAFGAWLAQIARRRAAAHHRRAGREAPLPADVPTHDRPVVEAEAALRAIQALPEAYAEPLMLRLVEGLSGAEIAERTGLSPNYVRVNLHRGMAMLRERLGPKGSTR